MLNMRAYVLVILFALGLFMVGAVGIRNNWGLFSPPTHERLLNLEAGNAAAYADGALDMAAVDLFFRVRPPANNEEIRRLEFLLDDSVLWLRDDMDQADLAQVCLTSVYAQVNPRGEFSYGHEFLREPVCVDFSPETYALEDVPFGGEIIDNALIVAPTDALRAAALPLGLESADDINLNFFYPYDRFEAELDIYVAYSFTLTDDEAYEGVIQPFLSWNLQTSGHRVWQIGVSSVSGTQPDDFFGEIPYDRVTFTFERPLIYRVIFPFFIVMMVLLIGLVPLLGDRDTLVDICAAMLFGIFGLKGIIGPGDAMGQTILDLSLVGLYVILAFAGLLFFVNKVTARRTDLQPDGK